MLNHTRTEKAFSLIELLVVIVVIGILAAIVVPNTIMAGDTARATAGAEEIRAVTKAIEAYRNETGTWPRDVNRATLPTELAPYFTKADPFAQVTPLGGVYDYDGTSGARGPLLKISPTSGNSIVVDAILLEADEELDDGVLETGRFVKSGSTVIYYVVPGDAP